MKRSTYQATYRETKKGIVELKSDNLMQTS